MLEMVPEAGSYTPFGDVEVENLSVDEVVVTIVGYVATHDEMERVLSGWQAEMAKPAGITWCPERHQRRRPGSVGLPPYRHTAGRHRPSGGSAARSGQIEHGGQ